MEHSLLQRRDYLPDGCHVLAEQRPGMLFPLHAHDYYELELVVDGQGEQTVNGELMPLSRGSLYLLSPGDFHEITDARGLTLWNMVFDEQILPAEAGHRLFGRLPYCRQVEGARLGRLERALALLAEEREPVAARLLAEYIFRLIGEGRDGAEVLTPVGRAVAYMEAHFREPLTLSQVAAVACLSPVYFGACFRREMGCTYVEYRNRCRADCAKMLLESGVTVTEACFGSGFGSLSGFLYTFRQQVGCTPQEYRKIHYQK